MPKFLALSGFHNSGKTTVGTYLVLRLLEKGYKVGVVKATKEHSELTDKPGSDTFRYKKAGAKQVALFQGDRMTLFVEHLPTERLKVLSLFERLFWDLDLVIFEGFKEWSEIPKIWIKKDEEGLPEGIENLLFVAKAEEKERIFHFVEDYLKEQTSLDKVKIFVNDVEVSLKPHLKLLCQNILFGILASLKGVPKIEEIRNVEVLIKK